MHIRRISIPGIALGLALLAMTHMVSAQTSQDIKLVLQVTVDGLRADLINRYRAGFGKDGFNYLLTRGAVYANAHYDGCGGAASSGPELPGS